MTDKQNNIDESQRRYAKQVNLSQKVAYFMISCT